MTVFVKTPVPTDEEVKSLPAGKRVDRGIRLQRIICRAAEELDKIKASLRSDAEERRKLEPWLSPVIFVGAIGSAKVTFKADSLRQKKEGQPIGLKDVLPPETFYRLFDIETIAVPVKDFKKKFEALPEDQKKIILNHFQWCPNAPAVEFSK